MGGGSGREAASRGGGSVAWTGMGRRQRRWTWAGRGGAALRCWDPEGLGAGQTGWELGRRALPPRPKGLDLLSMEEVLGGPRWLQSH